MVITICKSTGNIDTHYDWMECVSNCNCGRDSKERRTKIRHGKKEVPQTHHSWQDTITKTLRVLFRNMLTTFAKQSFLEVEPGLFAKAHVASELPVMHVNDLTPMQQGKFNHQARPPCHTTLSTCVVEAWDLVWMWLKASAAQLDQICD